MQTYAQHHSFEFFLSFLWCYDTTATESPSGYDLATSSSGFFTALKTSCAPQLCCSWEIRNHESVCKVTALQHGARAMPDLSYPSSQPWPAPAPCWFCKQASFGVSSLKLSDSCAKLFSKAWNQMGGGISWAAVLTLSEGPSATGSLCQVTPTQCHNHTTCLALPLSNRGATGDHPLEQRVGFVYGNYKIAQVAKKESSSPWMVCISSVQHTVGKSMWALTAAVCMWGVQQLHFTCCLHSSSYSVLLKQSLSYLLLGLTSLSLPSLPSTPPLEQNSCPGCSSYQIK